ncbi:sporulation integral membrane protein YtvI [Colidextribacter sp. OB.20]|uniref:sporulation integral membrane protein YtvI n=1 Tax=Colidextribacter sp. OB.20 TaxID=2304568 RepID=UPI00136EC439|nr:sporulation integral membrane protein YtvI [Colidextribacter sp. OB.20]
MTNKQLTWPQRGQLWLRLGLRLILAALAVWLLARFGGWALGLMAPFLFALAAAALLNPLVKRLQRALGWNRHALSALILILLFGLAGGGLALLVYAAAGQLMSLVQNWSGVLDSLQSAMDQLETLFARLLTLVPPQVTKIVEDTGDELFQWLYDAVPAVLADWGMEAGERAMGLPSFLVALVIFVMATFLMTADYPYLRSRAVQHLDEGVLHFLGQLRATALGAFGGYLKAEFLLSVGVFFILLAGFFLTGQPYGLLLALGLAVMDFIPIIGAGTVMVPWAFVALFTGDLPAAVELMVIWGVIALFRRVMEPKFVGDQTGLSPLLSLVSIYVGMKLAGVLGMVLGPVVVLVILNLAGMGMFRGLTLDLAAAARDIAAILSGRPE